MVHGAPGSSRPTIRYGNLTDKSEFTDACMENAPEGAPRARCMIKICVHDTASRHGGRRYGMDHQRNKQQRDPKHHQNRKQTACVELPIRHVFIARLALHALTRVQIPPSESDTRSASKPSPIPKGSAKQSRILPSANS